MGSGWNGVAKSLSVALLVLTALFCGGCAGCDDGTTSGASPGGGTAQPPWQGVTDNRRADIVRAVTEGLRSRWAITDAYVEMGEDVPPAELEGAVQAEYEAVEQFAEMQASPEQREDEVCQAVGGYVRSLEECREIKARCGTDQWRQEYCDVYLRRARALYRLDEALDEGLRFEWDSDGGFSRKLEHLLADGEIANTYDAVESEARFELEPSEDASGGEGETVYSSVIMNSGERDFASFTLHANLVDSSGVVVDTQLVTTRDWESGTAHKFTLTTSQEIESVEIVACESNLLSREQGVSATL